MQKIFSFVLLLIPCFSRAQSLSYNQYNAVLAEINPAYIAHIEKDYATLIGRMQWPGYAHSATMGSFAFNKSAERIHSGFGLTAGTVRYRNEAYTRQNLGLQYAYKVVFLNKYLLNFGAGLNLQQERAVMPVFNDGFSPKEAMHAHLLTSAEGKSIYGNYGIILQPGASVNWYAGFSVRNHFLFGLRTEENMSRRPCYSVQLMKALPVTRLTTAFLFFSYEYNGAMTYVNTPVRKSFSMLMLQANVLVNDKYSFGLGYKSFPGNYGLLHYRIGYTTGRSSHHRHEPSRYRLTIGFSYDIKPYIQNDRIRSFSSYEAFLKFKINYHKN